MFSSHSGFNRLLQKAVRELPSTKCQLKIKEVESTMGSRLKLLYNDQSTSDCSFIISNVEERDESVIFYAHKAILASASPVFHAMFYGALREKVFPVQITDTCVTAFEKVLYYMYTDTLEAEQCDINEFLAILIASKKYLLTKLEETCEKHLNKILCVENVWEIAQYAHSCGGQELMDNCLSVISENTAQVFAQPSFHGISVELLLSLLRTEMVMTIREVQLFQLIEEWAKSQLLEKNMARSAKNIRQVALKAAQEIRFLTMNLTDFATGPALSQILTKDESFAIMINIPLKGESTVHPYPENFSKIMDTRYLSMGKGRKYTNIFQAKADFSLSKNSNQICQVYEFDPIKLTYKHVSRFSGKVDIVKGKHYIVEGLRLFKEKEPPYRQALVPRQEEVSAQSTIFNDLVPIL